MKETTLSEDKAIAGLDQAEGIATYMVAEFEMLNQRAMQHDQTAANKTSFFLAVVTAVVGGTVLLVERYGLGPFLVSTFCMILAFLLGLGVIALSQILDLYAQSIFLFRRAGRIRRWFLDQDPSLKPYLPFVVSDDSPPYYIDRAGLRGTESVMLLVNSGIAGLLAAALIILAFSWTGLNTMLALQWQPYVLATMGGLFAFALGWQWQAGFVKRFLQKWQQREIRDGWVHFPLDAEARPDH